MRAGGVPSEGRCAPPRDETTLRLGALSSWREQARDALFMMLYQNGIYVGAGGHLLGYPRQQSTRCLDVNLFSLRFNRARDVEGPGRLTVFEATTEAPPLRADSRPRALRGGGESQPRAPVREAGQGGRRAGIWGTAWTAGRSPRSGFEVFAGRQFLSTAETTCPTRSQPRAETRRRLQRREVASSCRAQRRGGFAHVESPLERYHASRLRSLSLRRACKSCRRHPSAARQRRHAER